MLPAAIALLLLAPPAAADPIAPAEAAGCDNHGTLVSVGAGNQYHCEARPCPPEESCPADPCTNYGIIVLAGPNTYSCAGPCENQGVVVSVTGTYCERSGTFACYTHWCAEVALQDLPEPCPNVYPEVHPPGTWWLVVDCRREPHECSVGEGADCFAVRYACEQARRPVAYATGGRVVCAGWQGQPSSEPRYSGAGA